MKKRATKKLALNKETLVHLNRVVGGRIAAPDGEIPSAGPDICYFSDCNPCETTVYADDLVPIKQPVQDLAVKPAG